jgi:hypothetical protein
MAPAGVLPAGVCLSALLRQREVQIELFDRGDDLASAIAPVL